MNHLLGNKTSVVVLYGFHLLLRNQLIKKKRNLFKSRTTMDTLNSMLFLHTVQPMKTIQ